MDHKWPASKDAHLWGPWKPKSKKEQYRQCVHPECHEVQERIAPA